MDLVLKNALIVTEAQRGPLDIAIEAGRIAAIEPAIAADAETLDLGGRLVVPGFVESHIHLDKACILERCAAEEGTLAEAIREVSRAKRAFTVADIRARAVEVLERCIAQGTTACAAISKSTR